MGNTPGGGNSSNISNLTSCEEYESDKYRNVAMIAASTGTLSLLASLTVILVIVIFKKYNFFIQRLILYLCIAVALNSATIVMRFSRAKEYASETDSFHRLCIATAFIDQTTLWSVSLAFTCITFNMLMVVLFNRNTVLLEMGYFCFIFFFPIMFNWIPFIGNNYGEAGAWCWIRSHDYRNNCNEDTDGMIMQYALWYVPHYLLLSLLFVAYVVVIFRVICKKYQWRGLYSTSTEDQTQQLVMKEMVFPIIFYPLGFIILSIFPLVNRIYDTVFDNPNYILWVLHATFSPLQGGYIALVYVLDKGTLRRLNLRELKAYLFYRRTPVKEYPATRGFTDSYDASLLSQDDRESLASTEDEVLVNKGRRGRKDNGYGSTDESGGSSKYLLHGEKA